jgi:hypothetical protein
MTGLEDVLERVSGLMAALGARWAVVGGTAVILRALPRATRDVDVVLLMPVSRAREVASRAQALGFAIDPKEMEAFGEAGLIRLWMSPEKELGADLIFADDPFLERVVERATAMQSARLEVPVATAEDLLLLKLEANRPRDLDDAIALKDVCGPTLDRAYLKAQGAALDLTARLEALLGPL